MLNGTFLLSCFLAPKLAGLNALKCKACVVYRMEVPSKIFLRYSAGSSMLWA